MRRQVSHGPRQRNQGSEACTGEKGDVVTRPPDRMIARTLEAVVAEDDQGHDEDEGYPGGQVEIPLIGSVHSPRDRKPRWAPSKAYASEMRIHPLKARLSLVWPDFKRRQGCCESTSRRAVTSRPWGQQL